jgi:hypothetical protein
MTDSRRVERLVRREHDGEVAEAVLVAELARRYGAERVAPMLTLAVIVGTVTIDAGMVRPREATP